MKTYNLIENGIIHTSDLSLQDANEMKERHENFFPSHVWSVELSSESDFREIGYSLMDRQKRAYRH